MSATMILGRVLLPVLGLALGASLAWQYTTTLRAKSPGATMPSATVGNSAGSLGAPASPSASAPSTIAAEGRVVAYPGAQVVVGAEEAGTIARLAVREKAKVRKGDLLAEFKSDEARAAHREALSRLAEAEADLLRSQNEGFDLDLNKAQGRPAARARDAFPHELAAARARRDAARAAADRLGIAVERSRLLAPIDGVVTACHAFAGETVGAAGPVVTVVDLTRLRIEAEVDEFDIERCEVGQEVTITAEGFRGRSWRGVVEEIPDSVAGRAIRPQDPARPTDSSVFLVKISPREPTRLRLGQRVDVRISSPPR